MVNEADGEEEAWLSEQLAAQAEEEDEESAGPLNQLLQASENGKADEVEALIQQLGELGVSQQGEDGDTALHLACLYGRTECAKLLLDAGADVLARDEDDSTPLHDAAAGGHVEIVLKLLELAPELIRAQDQDGDTPLHNAARGGSIEVVQLLMDRGAAASAVNSNKETPEDVADPDTPQVLHILRSPSSAAAG